MSSSSPSLSLCSSCGASTSLVCAVCLRFHLCSRPCAAKAWPGHRAACAEFSVLAALPDEAPAPVPPAVPMASMISGPVASAGAPEPAEYAGSGRLCAVCGADDAAMCARCRLVGYCSVEHQRKDWPTHKTVCRKGEFSVVPVLSWEQRMLAEAHAAAAASLTAVAALPPIADWNFDRDGAPSAEIMRAWRKAADEGHSSAQSLLGFCYAAGMGVAQNVKAAVPWYTKAAAQGNANAQYNVGCLYKSGTGVSQDFKAAAAWYAKAAAQGFAIAQFNLGVFYAEEKGVAQDFKAAAAWYAKAAAQGYDNAQCNLGRLYDTGRGVLQDFNAAAAWYVKAAAQGHVDAQFNLGVLYENGQGVVHNFKAAAEWYAKAAAQGDADAPVRRDACLARAAAAAASCR